jgi:hypothetical protein
MMICGQVITRKGVFHFRLFVQKKTARGKKLFALCYQPTVKTLPVVP